MGEMSPGAAWWRFPLKGFVFRAGTHKERGVRRQLVGQAEIFPVNIAQELWEEHLSGRRVIWFVDNDAARHALIKGGSPSGPSAVLAEAFWDDEDKLGSFSWVERVPTQCNPADGPSRLFFQDAISLGAKVREAQEVLQLRRVRQFVRGMRAGCRATT